MLLAFVCAYMMMTFDSGKQEPLLINSDRGSGKYGGIQSREEGYSERSHNTPKEAQSFADGFSRAETDP